MTENYHTEKKLKAIEKGVHLMNKNEAAKLRQIKSETGLSEEEIRKIKKYRKELSDAQDAGEKELSSEENIKKQKAKLLKKITKKLKLAKEHPLVVEEFNKRWKDLNKFFIS